MGVSRRSFLVGVSAAAMTAALPAASAALPDVAPMFVYSDAESVKLWCRVLDHEALKYIEIGQWQQEW